ncbi:MULTISPECIES: phage tail assembly protein T [Bacteria]|uniref:Phage tail protein n=1 Tax=Serratia sarumanii TaxID=3020826 RepID=A0ABW8QK48_9GAMM
MNGIGGPTIAEAKERISINEFYTWLRYRQKYGSLNVMMRTEWGSALVASVIANANKMPDAAPFRIADFSPHMEEMPIDLEDAKKLWD